MMGSVFFVDMCNGGVLQGETGFLVGGILIF